VRADSTAAPGRGTIWPPAHTALLALAAAAALTGCGDDPADPPFELPAGARPVGAGPRFTPPLPDGEVARCRPGGLGERFGVHLELFGADRVVILPAGLGTEPPRETRAGRIAGAACFGPLVTIDPTGLLLLRPGTHATVGDVFALWGQPLTRTRAAGFRGRVRAYVDGRRVGGHPARIPLRRHENVVLQVGPYVPPHDDYTFPAQF
jgi:hypothetical protein